VTQRRLIELFVPGLAARWRANLIPEPWTNKRPVRLVTARTILLAGMATALDDRAAALGVLTSAASYAPIAILVLWCPAWEQRPTTLSLTDDR
jgi:hypothetical protein